MRLVIATGNKGKLREIREMLGEGSSYEVVSQAEAGFTGEIEETGASFAENALIKAETVRNGLDSTKDTVVLADDSGLAVDYLNGEPGIYSARYLGEKTSYPEKMADILRRMEGVEPEERTARFICSMAAILPDGQVLRTEGTMEGRIADRPAGESGFGYDPVVLLPQLGRTVAELDENEKNALSHRYHALKEMAELLKRCRER